MAHLIVSFIVAFAAAYSVYGETSSLLWAFATYSMIGTLSMLVLLAGTAVLIKARHSNPMQVAQA